MTPLTIKTSASIKLPLYNLLKKSDNKSKVINDALEIYFSREKMLKKSENEYWQNVSDNLSNGLGNYISLNAKKQLNKKDLAEKLWS